MARTASRNTKNKKVILKGRDLKVLMKAEYRMKAIVIKWPRHYREKMGARTANSLAKTSLINCTRLDKS